MIQIKLHNSKTRRKELLVPLDPKNLRMYVCGPTVYDRAHLGNARAVVVFDSLFRLLREVYGADHVTYARNFTDIDDKINAKSAETGRDIGQITEETIGSVSYTHLRAHETPEHLVCRLLLEKNKHDILSIM